MRFFVLDLVTPPAVVFKPSLAIAIFFVFVVFEIEIASVDAAALIFSFVIVVFEIELASVDASALIIFFVIVIL
jgi:hypothetical protein